MVIFFMLTLMMFGMSRADIICVNETNIVNSEISVRAGNCQRSSYQISKIKNLEITNISKSLTITDGGTGNITIMNSHLTSFSYDRSLWMIGDLRFKNVNFERGGSFSLRSSGPKRIYFEKVIFSAPFDIVVPTEYRSEFYFKDCIFNTTYPFSGQLSNTTVREVGCDTTSTLCVAIPSKWKDFNISQPASCGKPACVPKLEIPSTNSSEISKTESLSGTNSKNPTKSNYITASKSHVSISESTVRTGTILPPPPTSTQSVRLETEIPITHIPTDSPQTTDIPTTIPSTTNIPITTQTPTTQAPTTPAPQRMSTKTIPIQEKNTPVDPTVPQGLQQATSVAQTTASVVVSAGTAFAPGMKSQVSNFDTTASFYLACEDRFTQDADISEYQIHIPGDTSKRSYYLMTILIYTITYLLYLSLYMFKVNIKYPLIPMTVFMIFFNYYIPQISRDSIYFVSTAPDALTISATIAFFCIIVHFFILIASGPISILRTSIFGEEEKSETFKIKQDYKQFLYEYVNKSTYPFMGYYGNYVDSVTKTQYKGFSLIDILVAILISSIAGSPFVSCSSAAKVSLAINIFYFIINVMSNIFISGYENKINKFKAVLQLLTSILTVMGTENIDVASILSGLLLFNSFFWILELIVSLILTFLDSRREKRWKESIRSPMYEKETALLIDEIVLCETPSPGPSTPRSGSDSYSIFIKTDREGSTGSTETHDSLDSGKSYSISIQSDHSENPLNYIENSSSSSSLRSVSTSPFKLSKNVYSPARPIDDYECL